MAYAVFDIGDAEEYKINYPQQWCHRGEKRVWIHIRVTPKCH